MSPEWCRLDSFRVAREEVHQSDGSDAGWIKVDQQGSSRTHLEDWSNECEVQVSPWVSSNLCDWSRHGPSVKGHLCLLYCIFQNIVISNEGKKFVCVTSSTQKKLWRRRKTRTGRKDFISIVTVPRFAEWNLHARSRSGQQAIKSYKDPKHEGQEIPSIEYKPVVHDTNSTSEVKCPGESNERNPYFFCCQRRFSETEDCEYRFTQSSSCDSPEISRTNLWKQWDVSGLFGEIEVCTGIGNFELLAIAPEQLTPARRRQSRSKNWDIFLCCEDDRRFSTYEPCPCSRSHQRDQKCKRRLLACWCQKPRQKSGLMNYLWLNQREFELLDDDIKKSMQPFKPSSKPTRNKPLLVSLMNLCLRRCSKEITTNPFEWSVTNRTPTRATRRVGLSYNVKWCLRHLVDTHNQLFMRCAWDVLKNWPQSRPLSTSEHGQRRLRGVVASWLWWNSYNSTLILLYSKHVTKLRSCLLNISQVHCVCWSSSCNNHSLIGCIMSSDVDFISYKSLFVNSHLRKWGTGVIVCHETWDLGAFVLDLHGFASFILEHGKINRPIFPNNHFGPI